MWFNCLHINQIEVGQVYKFAGGRLGGWTPNAEFISPKLELGDKVVVKRIYYPGDKLPPAFSPNSDCYIHVIEVITEDGVDIIYNWWPDNPEISLSKVNDAI